MASNSRKFLNRELIPKFAYRFGTKQSVLCVGKHEYYDYSSLFTLRNCSYKTLDIDPELKPDIVADMEDTKLVDKSWDGIMATGMYECVNNWDKANKEMFRILKDDGFYLVTFAGPGFFRGTTEPYEVFEKAKPFKVIELYNTYYRNGNVEYISLICRK